MIDPRTARLATAAALLSFAACSSDPPKTTAADAPAASPDTPASPDAPATPDAHGTAADAQPGSSLTLHVPASYGGAPRQLAVVATQHVPIAGPPDAVLLTVDAPAVTAGHAMALTLDTSAVTGDLYVVAVLYQQGGGQFAPKSGVDYVAQSAAAFHFTGAPIDLGSLDLVLAP